MVGTRTRLIEGSLGGKGVPFPTKLLMSLVCKSSGSESGSIFLPSCLLLLHWPVPPSSVGTDTAVMLCLPHTLGLPHKECDMCLGRDLACDLEGEMQWGVWRENVEMGGIWKTQMSGSVECFTPSF